MIKAPINFTQAPYKVQAITPEQVSQWIQTIQPQAIQKVSSAPKLSLQQFWDTIKTKYPAYKDKDTIVVAKAMLQKYPEYQDRVDFDTTEYNWEDFQREQNQWIKNVVWWALASVSWAWRFVWQTLWKWVEMIADKVWSPETTQRIKQATDKTYGNQSIDIGWDTTSTAYRGTKFIWDVAQVANIWSKVEKIPMVANAVSKLGTMWKIGKTGASIGKIAVWALEWAGWQTAYNTVADQRLPTTKELAIWTAVGWLVWWLPVIKEWVKKIWSLSPIESTAKRITKTSTPQGKLFKALNPTLNVLNKNRNFKTLRNEADTANDLIVQSWFKPIDTETRRIAHEATMTKKRAEVESKISNKADLMVDQNQFADILDNVVADVKKSGLVKNKWDIDALVEQANAFRQQWPIDIATLEKRKQYINNLVDNRWDSAIGDVYKNWMKKVTRLIWKVEDDVLAKIPWEFSDLKKQFWALKSTYEDVLKADLKAQKAKWMDIIESYSRLEWAWDILWWILQTFTTGKQWIVDVWKWFGKLFLWKALKKASDVDFLIKEWFENLSSIK